MTYTSAQDLFTAALTDAAVRARLNKAAAESEGYTVTVGFRGIALLDAYKGAELPKPLKPVPDYCGSLTDAARLRLPEGIGEIMITIRSRPMDNGAIGFAMTGLSNSVDFTDPDHEALARVCCVAAASGWEVAP